MNTIRALLFWPVIVGVVWYFFSFETAVVVGLVYIHLMILLMSYAMENLTKAVQEIAKAADREIAGLRAELMDEIDNKMDAEEPVISDLDY
ncbi:hypothetical protein GF380_05275 [Candidatus Uhrbacteria bacterium]|nr:hypothetical protein [Candidatus Uhrbacteria bacterium]MBD3284443.1 hypothetical protein [Candidatus Uhrbacteria bacterium]